MNIIKKILAVIIMAIPVLLFLSITVHECRAEESRALPAFYVATGFLVAPLIVGNNGLTYGHAMELEGWSSAAVFIGEEIFPGDLRWLSPIIVETFNVIYRTSELGKGHDDLVWRKLSADSLGVLGTTIIKLDF